MGDERILKSFRGRKVLTVEDLTRLLKSSAITARRRLKQWSAYTSINRNGRYYVLPEVAEFDEKGLWKHHMIFFSRHGNLRKTIEQLIKESEAGLSAREISERVGLRANSSFLSGFRDVSGIRRERQQGRYIYFSEEEDFYLRQKEHREQLLIREVRQMPPDADAVLILVDRIKRPEASIEQCARRLQKKMKHIRIEAVYALLEYHGLLKKTPDTCS
ncbi:MAG: hypothetical protein JRF37_05210 [Deltaproteobacteria bacterium]|nr:hypothetical protein [Deltaproteobacteria bacterium]